MHDHDEGKGCCTFLTLFPTSLSVQFTMILTCHAHYGWYPTRLILHPERYDACSSHTLYLPLPQERMTSFLQAHQNGTAPPLFHDLIEVTLLPDTTGNLTWYQVQCSE